MIVFDLDDTLYKEADYVSSGIRTVAQWAQKHDVMSHTRLISIVENAATVAQGWEKVVAETKADITVGDLLAVYRAHTTDAKMSDEAVSTLSALKMRGVPLGLITDGRASGQWGKINSLGVEGFIPRENIIVSADYNTDKRSAVPFEMMMHRNPSEDRFLYVGDNVAKDFYWPNRLGWQTVMLMDIKGVNTHPQLTDRDGKVGDTYITAPHRPAIVIQRLTALLGL